MKLLFDLTKPSSIPRRISGKESAFALKCSPDGDQIAVPTLGAEVRLFDPVNGILIESLRSHLNIALAVGFSPDGKRFFSTSFGHEGVKLWDARTRQELINLHSDTFIDFAEWSPDGNSIVGGNPVQAWSAPSLEEIAAVEAKEKAEGQIP